MTSQSFKWRVIFWEPPVSRAPALTSQLSDITPTGRPPSRARPTIAVLPQSAPISNHESASTTFRTMALASYIRVFFRGMILLKSVSDLEIGSSHSTMGGSFDWPQLGKYESTFLICSKHSASFAAKLSIVPFVQWILGPPRSRSVRSSSNVANSTTCGPALNKLPMSPAMTEKWQDTARAAPIPIYRLSSAGEGPKGWSVPVFIHTAGPRTAARLGRPMLRPLIASRNPGTPGTYDHPFVLMVLTDPPPEDPSVSLTIGSCIARASFSAYTCADA